jgi:hypothetical protein
LTRPFDRHLDTDELDALVWPEGERVQSSEHLSAQAIEEAQHHLESCENCHRKVQMHRTVQSEISGRTSRKGDTKGPNCSDETEWAKVAAGLFEETEARELMKHAAQCGHCGPLLKAAAKDFSAEASPDEEALLTDLKSSRPDWQARMAKTLRNFVSW